jgi:hypothetical protein
VDARKAGVVLLLAATMLGAGCGPEADCKSGIKLMRPRVDGALGKGLYPEATEQINQAYADVDEAERRLKAGDFEGCLARLESARVLLNKSQRH